MYLLVGIPRQYLLFVHLYWLLLYLVHFEVAMLFLLILSVNETGGLIDFFLRIFTAIS